MATEGSGVCEPFDRGRLDSDRASSQPGSVEVAVGAVAACSPLGHSEGVGGFGKGEEFALGVPRMDLFSSPSRGCASDL